MKCVSHPLNIFNLALALTSCQCDMLRSIFVNPGADNNEQLNDHPLTCPFVSDEMKDYIRSLSK